MMKLVTHQHIAPRHNVEIWFVLGKPPAGKGRRKTYSVQVVYKYSIAIRLRAQSNEGLLVTLLLYRIVQVILEERINAFLVNLGEAQLLLNRWSEPRRETFAITPCKMPC